VLRLFSRSQLFGVQPSGALLQRRPSLDICQVQSRRRKQRHEGATASLRKKVRNHQTEVIDDVRVPAAKVRDAP
jgi:hypothetical protein